MSDGLVEFLRARLADEERTVYDEWDSDGRAQVAVMWTGPEPGYTTVAMAHPGTPWVADGREVTDARHVHVLFDPARVLAEVEAKRALIYKITGHIADLGRTVYAEWGGEMHKQAARDLLALLALPYSGHPEYRAEWKPLNLNH